MTLNWIIATWTIIWIVALYFSTWNLWDAIHDCRAVWGNEKSPDEDRHAAMWFVRQDLFKVGACGAMAVVGVNAVFGGEPDIGRWLVLAAALAIAINQVWNRVDRHLIIALIRRTRERQQ